MEIELTAVRNDRADETPVVFRINKALVFTSENARIDFQAEVWCDDNVIARHAQALRAFCACIVSGEVADAVSVRFGLDRTNATLNVHPGECSLEFSPKSFRRILVRVGLTSLPPGMNSVELLDTCVLHFQTDLSSIETFVSQLEQAGDAAWRASLFGEEPGYS